MWHDKCFNVDGRLGYISQMLNYLVKPFNQDLTLTKGVSMEMISKFKISFVVFLSLCSTSVFAGIAPPVSVPEPGILGLLAAGAVAVLYVTKKRKK